MIWSPLLAYRSPNIVGLHLMIFLSIIHTFLLVALPLLVLNLLSSNMWVCPNIGYISTWLLHCGKQISKPPNFGITYFQTNPDISWLSPVLSYSKIIEVPIVHPWHISSETSNFPSFTCFFSRAQSDASSFLKDYQVAISTQETMSVHCSTCERPGLGWWFRPWFARHIEVLMVGVDAYPCLSTLPALG